jgi:hypothetical protein
MGIMKLDRAMEIFTGENLNDSSTYCYRLRSKVLSYKLFPRGLLIFELSSNWAGSLPTDPKRRTQQECRYTSLEIRKLPGNRKSNIAETASS